MKLTLASGGALLAFGLAFVSPASAQGVRFEIEDAKALHTQVITACAGYTGKKACGVVVYAAEPCNTRDPGHVRQVYGAYPDGSLRFQAGQSGVQRGPTAQLLVGLSIIDRNGKTTAYRNPQFVSWDEYSAGKRSVEVCSKTQKLEASDFIVDSQVEKFLKANP